MLQTSFLPEPASQEILHDPLPPSCYRLF